MQIPVDMTPELSIVDLAFELHGSEITNKPDAVATIEDNLPKAFSQVMTDTLEKAKRREFDPKRTEWLKMQGASKSGWENYSGVC